MDQAADHLHPIPGHQRRRPRTVQGLVEAGRRVSARVQGRQSQVSARLERDAPGTLKSHCEASRYAKLMSIDKVDLLIGPYSTNIIAATLPALIQSNRTTIGIFGLGANKAFNYP